MSINGFGKCTFDSPYKRNYTVETDIKFNQSFSAGILLRANNPAMGDAGTSPSMGKNFVQAYYIGFAMNYIALYKQNYDINKLVSYNTTHALDTWYHLKAVIKDNQIQVFLDDMENPVINYEDTIPFINGSPGLRSSGADVVYDNLVISSDTTLYEEPGDTSTTNANNDIVGQEYTNDFNIYPNPATENIELYFTNNASRIITITKMQGERVIHKEITDYHVTVNVSDLKKGVYIISIEENGILVAKKLILI